jgi:hypothetical protein
LSLSTDHRFAASAPTDCSSTANAIYNKKPHRLLGEGYLHGMNTSAEAVLQVQGRCGPRQAGRHEVIVTTSGALMDGSTLVLTTDR